MIELFCRRKALVWGAVGIIAPAWSGTAASQPAPIVGSGDGQSFEYQCGPGQALVGLSGSAGVLIDNIQAICARVTPERSLADPAPRGPVFGGARPQDQSVSCPPQTVVVSATVWKNQNYPEVGAIRLQCQQANDLRDGGYSSAEFRGSGNLEGYSSPFGLVGHLERNGGDSSDCPDGSVAVGIRGRAGGQLAAFGLYCGPLAAERTLGLRRKENVVGRRGAADSTSSSIPQTQRTLNKRRKPGSYGAAQPAPAIDNVPPGVGGFSVNADSQLPPPVEEPGVSPLIAGTYAMSVTVRERQCVQPVSGAWQGEVPVEAGNRITIPLQSLNAIFGGPLRLTANGTTLDQTVQVPIAVGNLVASQPVQVQGSFDPGYDTFDVVFSVDAPLCSVTGTATGRKIVQP